MTSFATSSTSLNCDCRYELKEQGKVNNDRIMINNLINNDVKEQKTEGNFRIWQRNLEDKIRKWVEEKGT